MPPGKSPRSSTVDWVKRRAIPAVSLAVIVFVAGMVAAHRRMAPYALVETAAREWQDITSATEARRYRHHELPLGRDSTGGVTVHDTARAFPGATLIVGYREGLFTPFLVDMDGAILHRWSVDFHEIWPDPEHEAFPLPSHQQSIHGVHLYPDGDLVFNFSYRGTVRVDRCSRVRWTLPEQTHHSLAVDGDGSIWVLGRDRVTEGAAVLPKMAPPYFDDTVIHLSADGKVLDRISILQALRDGSYDGIVMNGDPGDPRVREQDPLHTNDVEIVTPAFAERFPQVETGDLLLSLRTPNTLLVLDPDTRQVKWTYRGHFVRQHDPDILHDGTLIVYDNRTDVRRTPPYQNLDRPGALGYSRIVHFDPASTEILWTFQGSDAYPFYSSIQGRQQPLPNGNVLVVNPEGGKVFEVARSGEVVWEFVNRTPGSGYKGRVTEAIRLDRTPQFAGIPCE